VRNVEHFTVFSDVPSGNIADSSGRPDFFNLFFGYCPREAECRITGRASDTEKCFRDMISLMDSCDESLDVIVLPEYSDIPAAQKHV